MKPLWRGLAVAVLQLLVLLGIAGRFAYQRATMPREWVRVHVVSSTSPFRGKYVWLQPDGLQTPKFEYFVSEHEPDPAAVKPGEELWAEVSRFPYGFRAIRLEIRRTR